MRSSLPETRHQAGSPQALAAISVPPRVCYIAGREQSYSRTRIMLKALALAGCQVEAITPPDKRFRHYPALLWRFVWAARRCDLVVVGFYGTLLMPAVRLLTRRPILFDVIVSTVEVWEDWTQGRLHPMKRALYYWVDRLALTCADRIILETNDHILRRSRMYRIDAAKFERVFIPTDEEVMFPAAARQQPGGPFLVHFHGEFAPFHGVRYILEAAKLLEGEDIDFQLIGRGITYEDDRRRAGALGLTRVRFIDPVPFDGLGDYIRRADVCLGVFGEGRRAREELTNKVVEQLACRKALITSRSPAVQELVDDDQGALLVSPAAPKEIADAVLRLRHDRSLRERLARAGYDAYTESSGMHAFARRMRNVINALVSRSRE